MTITILDSVTPGAFGRLASTSTDALAGYDDGRYNDIGQIERDYPGHRHQAIAVFASDDGDWLDIETGDASPADAPGWVRRQHARGLARPGLYANASTMPAVRAALQHAGISRNSVRLIVAYYGNPPRPELPPDYDAHQWTDHWEGRNVDASVARDDFFDLPAPRRPKRRRILHRKSHHPPARRRAPVHPKVKGATIGASTGAWLPPLLHLLAGLHITPAEAGGIATVVAALVAYLTPANARK